MANNERDKKGGPAPTRPCPCKHPSHSAMRCGNQMGVDQEICAECKEHQREASR